MNIELHQNDISNKVFEKFLLAKELAVDTETMGLNIHRDRLCLLQISSGDGVAHLVKFDYNNYNNCNNLKAILENDNICKIFHFARFDLGVIKHYLKVNIANIYCTKIASKLVRTYTDSHGLKNICEEILGVELSKKQQSSYWGNANLSDKQLEYASSDVLYLHRLKEKLNQMLVREQKINLLEDCMKFLPTRVELDLKGFSLDIFAHQ
ncbi:MAG: ribonuclease H-like domain-containing protein [Rickettsiales bacterium]|jgi:ribonuclease D|nr:ribonuclease H-like domain-containing protein [Rickettsiales bacterium]